MGSSIAQFFCEDIYGFPLITCLYKLFFNRLSPQEISECVRYLISRNIAIHIGRQPAWGNLRLSDFVNKLFWII